MLQTRVIVALNFVRLPTWCQTSVSITLQMEGVPSKARNLQMNLLMGKLYRYARHNRAAIAYYKECLRFVSGS